jgi:glucose/arabinose dehydrogenase
MQAGRATGEYVDFMTGFVTADGDVWGRPVTVVETAAGALLVTDDAAGCVWRVTYR